jgi:Ca2+-binding RTX toxin-like protein
MTLTATINSSSGVNINYGATNYLDTITDAFDPASGRFGYFTVPFSGGSFTNSSQYGLAGADVDGDGVYDDGSAFLAGGNMTYSTATNTLSGTVDTLTFGTGLNNITVGGYGYSSTSMAVGSTDFTLSSLGLTGTDMNNVLYGLMNGDESYLEAWLASNAVIFNGGNGGDAYQGGTQADTLHGNAGNDTLAGGGGSDTINGGDGVDTVLGEAGNDTIDAGKGNDIINGGAGVDTLTGGDDADLFVFSAASDSAASAFDTITFFDAGGVLAATSVDKFDLDALNLTGFSGGGVAAANKAWFSGSTLYADTSGDTTADFAVAVTSLSGTLTAADFVF